MKPKGGERVKIDNEEFKPIIIKDKELLEIIDRIREEREGIIRLILDMANARGEVEKRKHIWFTKVIKKYNIPEEYVNMLVYNHEKKEISLGL